MGCAFQGDCAVLSEKENSQYIKTTEKENFHGAQMTFVVIWAPFLPALFVD